MRYCDSCNDSWRCVCASVCLYLFIQYRSPTHYHREDLHTNVEKKKRKRVSCLRGAAGPASATRETDKLLFDASSQFSPRIEMNAKIDLDFWLGRWTRIVHFFLLVKLSPRIRIYIYKCKKNMKEMYICSDLTGREWKNTQTRRVYVKCMATHRHAHKLGRRAFIIVFLLRRIHRVYEHQTHSHRRQPYRAASCTCVRVCVCARRLRTTVSLLSGFNSATHTNTHTHASARDIFSPEPNESDSRFFLSFLNNILMQMRIVKRCDSNTYHFQCTQSILAGERGQPIKWIHNI